MQCSARVTPSYAQASANNQLFKSPNTGMICLMVLCTPLVPILREGGFPLLGVWCLVHLASGMRSGVHIPARHMTSDYKTQGRLPNRSPLTSHQLQKAPSNMLAQTQTQTWKKQAFQRKLSEGNVQHSMQVRFAQPQCNIFHKAGGPVDVCRTSNYLLAVVCSSSVSDAPSIHDIDCDLGFGAVYSSKLARGWQD